MVRLKTTYLKKQIKKQDLETYGEESMAGSSPDPESDDDVAENLEKTVGTKLKSGDEFDLEKEVRLDERSRRSKN